MTYQDPIEPFASFSLTHVYYTPSDPLSAFSALLALIPHALIVSYTTLILATREAELFLLLAGQLSCEATNHILKHIIKQERPDGRLGDGYGMPSSHAQFMGFWSVSVLLFLWWRHRAAMSGRPRRIGGGDVDVDADAPVFLRSANRTIPVGERVAGSLGVVVLSLAVAASRVYLGYHSVEQVAVGFLTGVVLAVGWFVGMGWARREGLVGWAVQARVARWLRVRDLLVEEETGARGWEVWEERVAKMEGKKRE